jgi:hypothetical protein
MCPVCIATTSVIIAGAGSTAGILAVCVGKLKAVVGPRGYVPRQKPKEA